MQHTNGHLPRLRIIAIALLIIAIALLAAPRVLGHEQLMEAAVAVDAVG